MYMCIHTHYYAYVYIQIFIHNYDMAMCIIYVTAFWKIDLIVTNTEIHFCPYVYMYMEVTLMHYPETPRI